MAGSDPTERGEVPGIDIRALLDSMETTNELLRDIKEALFGPRNQRMVRLTVEAGTATNRVASHVRMRSTIIVISSDTAANLTLTIGSYTLRFRAVVGVIGFPFPVLLDRGVDLSGTFSAAATADVYVIGAVE